MSLFVNFDWNSVRICPWKGRLFCSDFIVQTLLFRLIVQTLLFSNTELGASRRVVWTVQWGGVWRLPRKFTKILRELWDSFCECQRNLLGGYVYDTTPRLAPHFGRVPEKSYFGRWLLIAQSGQFPGFLLVSRQYLADSMAQCGSSHRSCVLIIWAIYLTSPRSLWVRGEPQAQDTHLETFLSYPTWKKSQHCSQVIN